MERCKLLISRGIGFVIGWLHPDQLKTVAVVIDGARLQLTWSRLHSTPRKLNRHGLFCVALDGLRWFAVAAIEERDGCWDACAVVFERSDEGIDGCFCVAAGQFRQVYRAFDPAAWVAALPFLPGHSASLLCECQHCCPISWER